MTIPHLVICQAVGPFVTGTPLLGGYHRGCGFTQSFAHIPEVWGIQKQYTELFPLRQPSTLLPPLIFHDLPKSCFIVERPSIKSIIKYTYSVLSLRKVIVINHVFTWIFLLWLEGRYYQVQGYLMLCGTPFIRWRCLIPSDSYFSRVLGEKSQRTGQGLASITAP